jgi:hypothetical protein
MEKQIGIRSMASPFGNCSLSRNPSCKSCLNVSLSRSSICTIPLSLQHCLNWPFPAVSDFVFAKNSFDWFDLV